MGIGPRRALPAHLQPSPLKDPPESTAATDARVSGKSAVPVFEPRNFWAWVGYQFLFRVGWQFKLEATLVSGLISFLVSPTQAAVVLGWLGALSSVGRNTIPFFLAPWVANARYKRWPTLVMWASTVACWGLATLYLWLPGTADKTRTLWIFGACYVAFQTLLGGLGLAQSTLLGKIIPDRYRGRAVAFGMGYAGVFNVFALLGLAWFVRAGGFPEPRNFALSFSVAVFLFTLAGGALLVIKEQPSDTKRRSSNPLRHFREARRLVLENRNLQLLLVVNLVLAVSLSVMRLYTPYWRLLGTLDPSRLLVATVLQVAVQSLSSVYFGRLADRYGNRRVICTLLWVEAIAPLVAVLCGATALGNHWLAYLSVYFLIGLRFPLFLVVVNYLLEIVEPDQHAIALSAVTLVQLIAAVVPIGLGYAAQQWGYPAVLAPTAVLVAAGALFASRLGEPRFERSAEKP